MTPVAIILTDAEGTTVTVPIAASPGGGHHAVVTVDGDTFTVYVDTTRSGRPARTPAKARWR